MSDSAAAGFLAGGGEMGELMRAHDWASSPLGPPSGWPQTLRAQVRIMLNTQHPMYIWWGPSLICLYNDAYRQTLGPERHPGSLGQPGRLVWSEIWDIIGPQIEQVRSGRGATWNEDQLVPITRHGHRDDVFWTYGYSPIEDENAPNGIGGVLVICTETTVKVIAERRAAEELSRQRNLVQQMPGFVGILSGPQHVFEYANDAYIALSGYRPLLGREVRKAFPELASQGFFELLDQVYATGERYITRRTPVLFAGETEHRFVDFVYEPIRDNHGRVSGIFVGGFDVTDIYRTADALRQNEARLRHVIEAAHDQAILTVTTFGVLTSWSAGAEATFGFSADDMIGEAFSTLFTVEDRNAGLPDEYLREASHERVTIEDQWLVCRDGTRVLVSGSAHPLPLLGEGATPPELLIIVRDVTARQRADDALKQLMEALERRVAQQAQELHDSQDFARLALTCCGRRRRLDLRSQRRPFLL